MPYKDKTVRRAARRRYYLAHREEFRQRRLKWQRANRLQIKISKSMGVSLPEARRLLEADRLRKGPPNGLSEGY